MVLFAGIWSFGAGVLQSAEAFNEQMRAALRQRNYSLTPG
jgi:hypothetical protein